MRGFLDCAARFSEEKEDMVIFQIDQKSLKDEKQSGSFGWYIGIGLLMKGSINDRK